jgi:NAD(P)-dependent dehydrogenase (short-subunit alcohol dehydrogenase family)
VAELDLSDAVAVVTGATRGIGRQAAFALGRGGARVVVVGRSSDAEPNAYLPGTVEETVAALEAEGIDARPVQANLADPDDTDRIIERTLDWYGRCDVLVNNAAFTSNGSILDVPWRRWQTAFRLQVVAPMQLCQAFVPGMLERGWGRVLNVSSGASQSDLAGLSLYSVSKLAMERWGEYMQLELGGRGVSFNTLRVDRLVATEGWQHTADTQGIDVATGGRGLSELLSAETAADHIVWMVQQPDRWTGQTVGFADIVALGGPPTPSFSGGATDS